MWFYKKLPCRTDFESYCKLFVENPRLHTFHSQISRSDNWLKRYYEMFQTPRATRLGKKNEMPYYLFTNNQFTNSLLAVFSLPKNDALYKFITRENKEIREAKSRFQTSIYPDNRLQNNIYGKVTRHHKHTKFCNLVLLCYKQYVIRCFRSRRQTSLAIQQWFLFRKLGEIGKTTKPKSSGGPLQTFRTTPFISRSTPVHFQSFSL